MEQRPDPALRFGVFELDVRAGELRRRGLRVRLQRQPLRVLEMLLEHVGDVVTREELRARLWPAGMHVDFDHGLGAAINKIRDALGDSATHPRFVETLPGRGYRFLVPVGDIEPGANAVTATAPVRTVAVLPFESDGGPGSEYVSDGITLSLIASLGRLPGMRVMARSTVYRFRNAPDPVAVGRELGVGAVLTGRARHYGDMLAIAAELVQIPGGWQLWGAQYNRPASEILAVQEEVSREITDALSVRLDRAADARLSRRQTRDTEAYWDYVKGLHAMNRPSADGIHAALAHFESAIARDPAYALAHAGLAAACNQFGFFGVRPAAEVFPRARTAARTALDLDPDLAEAHAAHAAVLKGFDWDWPGAERAYRRALELDPRSVHARHSFAAYLSAVGRHEEARREVQRAQEFDPLSVMLRLESAWGLYMARDPRAACRVARQALELEPSSPAVHHVLGLCLLADGRPSEALELLQRAHSASRSNPASLAAIGCALVAMERQGEAAMLLDQLESAARDAYVSPYVIALLETALGDVNGAFEQLGKAVARRDVWLVWAGCEPLLDRLRPDARFGRLLRRIKYPGTIDVPRTRRVRETGTEGTAGLFR